MHTHTYMLTHTRMFAALSSAPTGSLICLSPSAFCSVAWLTQAGLRGWEEVLLLTLSPCQAASKLSFTSSEQLSLATKELRGCRGGRHRHAQGMLSRRPGAASSFFPCTSSLSPGGRLSGQGLSKSQPLLLSFLSETAKVTSWRKG